MDDVRGSLSGLKHDIKHLLGRNKRKADEKWADGREERRGSPGPSARPESQAVMDSDLEREGNESDMDVEDLGPSVAPDENNSGWRSTVSASAKLLLRGVRDSADALGPLKSIAGGLCFILENCEVRLPSYAIRNAHRSHSARRQISGQSNRWHLGSMRLPSCSAGPLPWVISRSRKGEGVSNSTCIHREDEAQNLIYVDGRKLQNVRRDLLPLEKQGKAEGFFKNTKNSGKLTGLAEDIRDAMMEYQVCIHNPTIKNTFDFCQTSRQQGIFDKSCHSIVSSIPLLYVFMV